MRALLLAAGVSVVAHAALTRGAGIALPLWHPTGGGRRAMAPALALLVAGCAVLAPPLAVGAGIAWWARRRLVRRRAVREAADDVARGLPIAVDLLILATSAGLPLATAHPLVAEHAPPPVGAALRTAHQVAAAGRPRADALVQALAPLGDRAHALGQALGDHLRYGVPLLPALERASFELALDRRRRAELAARRVPVQLLGPLVTCVLPAFGLLTIVPLLGASLRALPT